MISCDLQGVRLNPGSYGIAGDANTTRLSRAALKQVVITINEQSKYCYLQRVIIGEQITLQLYLTIVFLLIYNCLLHPTHCCFSQFKMKSLNISQVTPRDLRLPAVRHQQPDFYKQKHKHMNIANRIKIKANNHGSQEKAEHSQYLSA